MFCTSRLHHAVYLYETQIYCSILENVTQCFPIYEIKYLCLTIYCNILKAEIICIVCKILQQAGLFSFFTAGQENEENVYSTTSELEIICNKSSYVSK